MRDFTLQTYKQLLLKLQSVGYRFITFEQYCEAVQNASKNQEATIYDTPFVILRHDVDLKAINSLRTAEIEAALGMQASYYFRVVPQSNQPNIIQSIARLGHEIGYHYEDMAIANGNIEAAIEHFRRKLSYFRNFYPVRTICMHGAPTSRYDGRDLWRQYDYRQEGLIGEPYFDADFSHMLYLTDTGRSWDGYKVSVRDKIPAHQDRWSREGLTYHHTDDLMRALDDPTSAIRRQRPCIMITTHPQRWTDNQVEWVRELVMQSLKNIVKRILILIR